MALERLSPTEGKVEFLWKRPAYAVQEFRGVVEFIFPAEGHMSCDERVLHRVQYAPSLLNSDGSGVRDKECELDSCRHVAK